MQSLWQGRIDPTKLTRVDSTRTGFYIHDRYTNSTIEKIKMAEKERFGILLFLLKIMSKSSSMKPRLGVYATSNEEGKILIENFTYVE